MAFFERFARFAQATAALALDHDEARAPLVPWPVIFVDGMLEQGNGFDCGLWTIEYMFALAMPGVTFPPGEEARADPAKAARLPDFKGAFAELRGVGSSSRGRQWYMSCIMHGRFVPDPSPPTPRGRMLSMPL